MQENVLLISCNNVISCLVVDFKVCSWSLLLFLANSRKWVFYILDVSYKGQNTRWWKNTGRKMLWCIRLALFKFWCCLKCFLRAWVCGCDHLFLIQLIILHSKYTPLQRLSFCPTLSSVSKKCFKKR